MQRIRLSTFHESKRQLDIWRRSDIDKIEVICCTIHAWNKCIILGTVCYNKVGGTVGRRGNIAEKTNLGDTQGVGGGGSGPVAKLPEKTSNSIVEGRPR